MLDSVCLWRKIYSCPLKLPCPPNLVYGFNSQTLKNPLLSIFLVVKWGHSSTSCHKNKKHHFVWKKKDNQQAAKDDSFTPNGKKMNNQLSTKEDCQEVLKVDLKECFPSNALKMGKGFASDCMLYLLSKRVSFEEKDPCFELKQSSLKHFFKPP